MPEASAIFGIAIVAFGMALTPGPNMIHLNMTALLGAVLAGESLAPIQLVGFGLALAAMVAGQLTAKPVSLPRPKGSP